MLGAGAGYAFARRKRFFKNGMTILLACVMLLSMTQCKKKLNTISTSDATPVFITLEVNDGSKVIVNPTGGEGFATVSFEVNDTIYVGNNGYFCGKLVFNGTRFEGTVTPTSEDNTDYLHFYFMGNKKPSAKPVANTTTTFSVNITDQTSKYPVISYARSTKLYKSGLTSYSAKLQNYCAIVKFLIKMLKTSIYLQVMPFLLLV